MIRFDWDDAKSRANRRKHGVGFEEAQTVFFDDRAIEFADPDHSDEEDRFLLLGRSAQLRILVVCHCVRASSREIRIISARKATKTEKTSYMTRGKR